MDQPGLGSGPEPSPSEDPGRGLSIEFESATLDLSPGDSRSVQFSVSPAGQYEVVIALLGDTQGAYTDQSQLVTAPDGTARVQVTVPSDSVNLTLRAAIGSAKAELAVNVDRQALSSLRITPEYSGSRPINHWSVSIQRDTPCRGLSLYETPFPDPARVDPPLVVQEVLANRRVTILVRGEKYVFGCREGVFLQPIQEQAVSVQVTDRPIQLAELNLPIAIGLSSNPELLAALNHVMTSMVGAFRGGADHDISALLQRMAQASPSEPAFLAQAQAEDWLALLETALTQEGARAGLSSRVLLWLNEGARVLLGEHTFEGMLIGNIPPSTRALLTLTAAGGIPPREVGIPDSFLINVATASEDKLQLAAQLLWQPERLLARLAQGVAAAQLLAREPSLLDGGVAEPADVTTTSAAGSDQPVALVRDAGPPTAAAYTFDCAAVASLLSGSDGLAFEGCDSACLNQLCEESIVEMWQRAQALDFTPASLELSSVQDTELDSEARPLGFEGEWVGRANFEFERAIAVGGSLSAGH